MTEMLTEMMMGLSSKNMSEYIKVVVKSKIVGHQGLQRWGGDGGGGGAGTHCSRNSSKVLFINLEIHDIYV